MRAKPRLLLVGVLLVAACGRGDHGSGKAASTGSSTGTGSGAGTGSAAPPDPAAVTKAIETAKAALVPAAHPDGTLQLVGIDVLTPPDVFKSRAAGAGPKPMEPLVNAAKAAVAEVDGARAGELGDTVVVWLAMRPGHKLRVWVACPGKPDANPARAAVATRLAAAVPPDVTGQVAFAITFDRSGARPHTKNIALPPELEAVRGPVGDGPTPDALVERAWKP